MPGFNLANLSHIMNKSVGQGCRLTFQGLAIAQKDYLISAGILLREFLKKWPNPGLFCLFRSFQAQILQTSAGFEL